MNGHPTDELTEEAKLDHDAIASLVRSLIDYGDALVLTGREVPGEMHWRMRVHPRDQGKVRGKMGSHVIALEHLVRKMGEARGGIYTITVEEPAERMRHDSPRPLPVATYDIDGPTATLVAALEALGLDNFRVGVETKKPQFLRDFLTVEFSIHVGRKEAYTRLIQLDERRLSIIGSLGTLFRAIGNHDGVKIVLKVQMP